MKSDLRVVYGGIEAGGTKFVCTVGTGPEDIRTMSRFDTTTPDETVGKVIDFFQKEAEKIPLRAIGIGSFGPLDLNPQSPTYGCITTTPKTDWANTNLVKPLREAFNIPVVLDTDVNAAALGEQKWGAASGLDTFIYLTVGTGIGGGGMANGRLMHGLLHPEMGHIRVPHDNQIDPFPGCCPFHGDCLEGLASGTAMEKRWGIPPEELPVDHPGWELETVYLAAGITNYICTISPQRIIVGGGILNMPDLLPKIRKKVIELLNDYVKSPKILDNIDNYIVAPGLGDRAGVLGAIALAEELVSSL